MALKTDRRWELTSDKEITEHEAEQYQQNRGFHPAGYGLYEFKCIQNDDDTWTATWVCSNSCD